MDVRESHSKVCEGSGSPPREPEWVGRPTVWSGRSRESHPEVWEESGIPPGGP